ncbi:MAG: Clp amino terminal protein [Nocardia sp.]|uniref:Clp protease N-terminal domain-containing protein n=1 Tax=Nocardia sp. TaxID=1821 RepID=UPI002614662D|nr:Clp protease N-terminal domain-containing protein [Nocardia sp.]MCU1641609.1 Clp amino terminal protein [Nocardia sp.]
MRTDTGTMTNAEARYTPRLKALLEAADEIATAAGHTYTGAEHVALAMLRDPAAIPTREIATMGLNPDAIAEQIETVMASDGYRTPSNQARRLDGSVVTATE